MKHATVFAGLLIAVLIFSQLPAFAVGTGRLSATVYDASGAVIPNAKVVLKSETANTTRETVTNNSGLFDFEAVLPGSYSVTVTAPGFTSWEGRGIVMTQGADATLPNITLNVRGAKQEVTVVSASEMIVPVDTGQSSTTLNSQMISQLSIQGRDAAELIKIMPGMGFTNGLAQGSAFDSTQGTSNNNGPIGKYSANGTQPYGAMTMSSDGANLLDPGNQGTQVANINADQTAEVTLLTSAYGAEFAKGPVTFQAIGKSGGSQFHGSAYFYARNSDFNSEDSYIKSQGVAKPNDHYYYPGGDFGGPVLIPGTGFNKNRDKLFFYAAFEDMRQQTAGYLKSYFLPTADMMGQNSSKAYGDFTPQYIGYTYNGTKYPGVLGLNYMNGYGTGAVAPCGNTYSASGAVVTNGGCNGASNNAGGTIGNGSGVVYPGGEIPLSMINQSSINYWKTFPAPNANSATNSSGSNYQVLINPPQNRWELRLRGDYNISDNTKLFFSWNRQDETDQNPINIWWTTPGALPYPSALTAFQKSEVYSANLTHVFSPTLTNEFVFADATFVNPINMGNPDAVDPGKVGFNLVGMFTDPYKPQIPNVLTWDGAVSGYGAYTMGITGYVAQFGKTSQAPNISDNLSKVWGTHTVKVGMYWDFNRNWQTTGDQSHGAQGTLTYYNYQGQSTGNEIADFVTGRAALQQANGFATADFKYYQYSFYAQDAWKASRRLTITYGLRMDHMGQWFPATGPGLAVWNWASYVNNSTAGAWTGFLDHAQDSKIPVSGFPSTSFFPEPRIGVAYDLFGNGKTVLRGGFGEYRYQLAYNSVSGSSYSAPLGYQSQGTTWGCCIGYTSFNNYSPSLGKGGLGTGPSGVLTEGDARTPHSFTYNFTVSQRVPWNSVAEFQYSGNKSRDMMIDGGNLSNLSNIPVGAFFGPDPLTGVVNNPASSSFPTNDYYPLHEYTGVNTVTHGSYSSYNAFIATWQKQTGRITFTANYTFSKVLGIRDNETDNGTGQGTTVDPFNLKNNYGVLAFDHTHIINAAYVINLPSPVHGNMFLGGVVNGWELSGITQWQSGAPIQPNTAGSLNVQWPNTYSQAQDLGTNAFPNNGVTPLVICDPRNGLASGQYFNPACFAPPPLGQNGTLIWPYIKGPAYFNSDLSLYKNFNFKEHHQIQFRFQTYNFMNHPLAQFNADGNNSDIKLNFNNNNSISMTNLNDLTTGKPLHTVGRRVVMFSLKYQF